MSERDDNKSRRTRTIDRLNQALRAAEAHLEALNLGSDGVVELPIDELLLTWTKHKGRWGLYVERETDSALESDYVPLLSAAPRVRLHAALALPALLSDIKDSLETELFEQAPKAASVAIAFSRGVYDFDRPAAEPGPDAPPPPASGGDGLCS